MNYSRFAVRHMRAATCRRPQLFSRVMRLRRFWLRRFLGWFSLRLEPLCVKNAGSIDPLIGMRAEEVALCLKKVCGQTSGAIAIEICERRGKSGDRYSVFDGGRNDDAPAALRLFNGPGEITIKQQIVQGGIALVRLHDAVEKSRANDAAASPNCRDVAEIKVPVVDFACGSKQLHPLRVRNNFRRIKRIDRKSTR